MYSLFILTVLIWSTNVAKMSVEMPVREGYLNIPAQSSFSINRISKKKSNQRYCQLYKSSRHGIERLEVYETKDGTNPKIITLENCVKITQKSPPENLIHIVKKNGTLTLNTLNDEDLKEWTNALQFVAFRDNNTIQSFNSVIEEDNDLYCCSYSEGLFIVRLIPSEISIRCNIEVREYFLQLAATEIQLKSTENLNELIATWPYRFIRKYGYRDGKFTFEAGRKCSTGEGVFILEYSSPKEIFRCMSAKMKSMKKLISNEHNFSVTDSVENHFCIAATMEAGSRSPLPASSSSHQVTNFEINPAHFNSPIIGVANISKHSNASNIQRTISNTTKLLAETSNSFQSSIENRGGKYFLKNNKHNSYEAVAITTTVDPLKAGGSSLTLNQSYTPNLFSKPTSVLSSTLTRNFDCDKIKLEREYDKIETVTEAWKTLGLENIDHTERCNFTEYEPNKNSNVFATDIDVSDHEQQCIEEEDCSERYDRLDFLSANNKTSRGYKTVINVFPQDNHTRKIKSNHHSSSGDYEVVAQNSNVCQRKNNDNRLVYGVLRPLPAPLATTNNSSIPDSGKNLMLESSFPGNEDKSLFSTDNDRPSDHEICKVPNYTVVSKPKRV